MISPERLRRLAVNVNVKGERDVYERLANTIAPSVYGNLNIKKGILLQMVGGVDKV